MRNNSFYTDFDFECVDRRRTDDIRSPFQKDRDRILYTSAFRRLQAKTQVFLSGEYDFYRTRLTHSLEVAQIGRSICQFLQHTSAELADDRFIDYDLVEAICLSHDLGHPPFGHAGEKTLNRLMSAYGGFEGNAQTLRILTETIYSESDRRTGMNPTRALLDGVLKYKTLHRFLDNPLNHFIYDDQARYLDFVLGGRDFPAERPPGKTRDRFRSIECQIMDWADDTAYSINDIVDGINAGFLTIEKIERWGQEENLESDAARHLLEILRFIRERRVNRSFSFLIGRFIQACGLQPQQTFMNDLTQRYSYRLAIDPEIKRQAELYKKLSFDLVFQSAQIFQLEYKENRILSRLFDAFAETYLGDGAGESRLLPPSYETLVRRENDPTKKARWLCDHLAAMTDGFAIRSYKRFFDPDFGSIVDLV
ncbi:dNTP triphosphohydrolase [candidate division KSB1 bacterium]|nr:dNTP triphosphohydrolase [candidate division KSB1 bacterium]